MTTCEWVDWCEREGDHEVEMSNRAGSERMSVCRLHLAAAHIYGYRDLALSEPPREASPEPAGERAGEPAGESPREPEGPEGDGAGDPRDEPADEGARSEAPDRRGGSRP